MTSKRKTKAYAAHLLSNGHAAKLYKACYKRKPGRQRSVRATTSMTCFGCDMLRH